MGDAAWLAPVLAAGAAILFGLAVAFGVRRSEGWLFTLSLAQAGEFGFVLLSFAAQNGVLGSELVDPLIAVIATSMALTPLLLLNTGCSVFGVIVCWIHWMPPFIRVPSTTQVVHVVVPKHRQWSADKRAHFFSHRKRDK